MPLAPLFAALLACCAPTSFAVLAAARARAALGPVDQYTTRELSTYVEGDYALVTVRERLDERVERTHSPIFPQVLVTRSGATHIFDSWYIGDGRTVMRSHTPQAVRDSVGVRRVATALLPAGARIYYMHHEADAWRPFWVVSALTSPLSETVPTGLVVDVYDTLAIIQEKFPRLKGEGYPPSDGPRALGTQR